MVKDLIRLFKYQKKMILGDDLAWFLYEHLRGEDSLWWSADALVPVPLHARRLRQRGFNQAEIVARMLSRLTGLDLQAKRLIKVRDAQPQTTLSGEDRRANLKGAYAVRGGRLIRGKTVILVDDVFTTGATMQECSRVLKEAGAREVRAVTIAQA
jgi:ComF family protein